MKTLLITNTFILLWILPGMSWAQFVTIAGYINDSTTGKAIENVSIFEKNSRIGTISNQNGFYRLVLSNANIDLRISNDGFKVFSSQMQLSSDTTLVVKLEPNSIRGNQLNKDQLQAGIDKKAKRTGRRDQEFK